MTVVHLETGEVLAPLTFDDAVELTESIRKSVADIEEKVIRAYYGRVWVAMGYESWDDYVKGEFKRAPLALPREERQTQVASLRSRGLSLPAIAAVTGVSHQTVGRDLQVVQMDEVPQRVTGIDGKEYAPSRPAPELTEAELQEKERQEAIRRAVHRLEELVNGWVQLRSLPTHPHRAEMLDQLHETDRTTVLEIEAMYKEMSS